MFISGRTLPALDFIQGQRRRLILMHEMATFMNDYDLYVTGRGDIVLTNQTGHPCVVVPTGMTEGDHSQPRCTVMVGQLFSDDVLLSVAHKYQVATEWHNKHPRLT
jgi:Asp-tRNA(Asn)/Glu-tRNA(Gln) amidotransferase A subunit family amidase